MGDVVVVIRVEGDARISLDDNENPPFTSSNIAKGTTDPGVDCFDQ